MRLRLLVLIVVFVGLAWLGNAAVVVSDRFGYEYGDDVSLGSLAGEVFSIGVLDVGASFFTNPFFGWVNLVMLLTGAGVIGVEVASPTYRNKALAAIAVVSVPLGLLALFSLVESLRLGLDGEWLGEGWPILEVFFFWSLALCLYALVQLRLPGRAPH